MLTVIESACKFDAEMRSGVIVVAAAAGAGSDAITDLGSKEARDLALSYASKQGIVGASVNGTPRSYAVDANGQEVTQDRLTGENPPPKTTAYWAEIPVIKKLF